MSQVKKILSFDSTQYILNKYGFNTCKQKNANNIDQNKNTMKGFIPCNIEELNLELTLKGGQSFRWKACNDKNSFRGVFNGICCTLSHENNKLFYTIHSSVSNHIDYDKELFNYFRLDVSLKDNFKTWTSNDAYFKNSYQNPGGVRILNQDIIENLLSFICSSNNNIIRISGMVEKLCLHFGKQLAVVEGVEYYDFPTIEALNEPNVESILRKEGFGYRAGYIVKTAQKLLNLGGRNWLFNLCKDKGATYEYARETLQTLPGVGPKVADCVCLMSLGHLEAIPVDTHIFQVACNNYTPELRSKKTVTPKIHQEVSSHLRELWGPLAGWAQAIVFSMKINSTNTNKKNKRKSFELNEKSMKVKKSKDKYTN